MPIQIVKPGTQINFLGKWRICVTISAALVLIGLLGIPVRGFRLGIDFAGGTEVQVRFLDAGGAGEGDIRDVVKDVHNIELPNPFPHISYAESMNRFGSDRPDLRCPLELIDVADLMADVEFKVFAGPAKDPRGRVAALRLPQGTELTRKEIDNPVMTDWLASHPSWMM